MLKDLTVENFLNELASNSPAPGGGSIAALSASLAAALNSMVINLTVGKKAYNAYDESVKESITESLNKTLQLKEEFLNIMEEDTQVFLKVMDAFKMPKETEEEKKLRKQKIDEAYKLALDVPRKLSKKAFQLYDYLKVSVEYGNINAISDAGVAALLLQTAIESAVLNVKINLSSVEEEEIRNSIKNECKELVEQGRHFRDELLVIVENKIEN